MAPSSNYVTFWDRMELGPFRLQYTSAHSGLDYKLSVGSDCLGRVTVVDVRDNYKPNNVSNNIGTGLVAALLLYSVGKGIQSLFKSKEEK